ncbi:MAG: hypothetical protein RLZZ238_419 [Planctomycetota bacterium]
MHERTMDTDATQLLWNTVDAEFCRWLGADDAALDAALIDSSSAGLPSIAVAPSQGRMLHVLARSMGARRILEIGTLGGYSTIWLARALPSDGELVSLEIDPRHAEVARTNIARAELAGKARVIVGSALDTLDAMIHRGSEPFDFVFIDADKENSANYLERALALTRAGAVIVVDNIVRRGRVIDPATGDASVDGVRTMLELAGRHPRLSSAGVQTVGAKGYDGFLIATVVQSAEAAASEPVPLPIPTSIARCRLRRWQASDRRSLVRHANDERVSRMLFDRFPFPYTEADADRWLAIATGAGDDLHLAIELDGEAIGGISAVRGGDVQRFTIELGYWLGESHAGRGIMTAAVHALCDALFAHTETERIEAGTFATNPASARVLEKAGFTCEGTRRRAYCKNGKFIDGLAFARVRA